MNMENVSLITFSTNSFVERKILNASDFININLELHVNWLQIVGVGQKDLFAQIAKAYQIHPLVIEDLLHTRQRPKVESYGEYLFITLRLFKGFKEKLISQQVSFILKNNLLISVTETKSSFIDDVKARIEKQQGVIRQKGEDFLLYSLLDAVIDSYFETLEILSKEIEGLEEKIILHPVKAHLIQLQSLKRQLIQLKKYTTPVRELLSNLDRNTTAFFEEENRLYLRDLLDHSFRVNDSVESYRDILTSLMDLYHSMMSNKMNEVMKTLTLLSSFFIPLTFIVGVYGMNFDIMPELRWKYGYYTVWIVMLVLCIGLYIFFKKRKWF
ncbi:MAG: magnesium and cobalt transport protein CorA [Bacteroidetes bacterium 37-13]|nr:MAG: magnesium and cobalt transport protein CorA [Bacteroidetes bacterium 37-13]